MVDAAMFLSPQRGLRETFALSAILAAYLVQAYLFETLFAYIDPPGYGGSVARIYLLIMTLMVALSTLSGPSNLPSRLPFSAIPIEPLIEHVAGDRVRNTNMRRLWSIWRDLTSDLKKPPRLLLITAHEINALTWALDEQDLVIAVSEGFIDACGPERMRVWLTRQLMELQLPSARYATFFILLLKPLTQPFIWGSTLLEGAPLPWKIPLFRQEGWRWIGLLPCVIGLLGWTLTCLIMQAYLGERALLLDRQVASLYTPEVVIASLKSIAHHHLGSFPARLQLWRLQGLHHEGWLSHALASPAQLKRRINLVKLMAEVPKGG